MKILFILFSTLFITQDKKIKFNPDKLIDPEPRWPIISSPLNSENFINDKIQIDSTKIIIEGFRIQILATNQLSKAEMLQKDLSDILNKKIYIVFEAPNYKVRVGNFIDRSKAENFRQNIIKKGYPSSWIIRTRIEPKIQ
tara:strand:- start:138 stop:557 length:420 start_codon:yes stop_codon:yes gene_type:complete